ncbi:hypothetical protein OG21DRAFT_1408373, partial [Imleria badia]
SVTPATMRRLMREISELKNSPAEGIRIVTSDENILDVTGIIEGPEGTPYVGGYFRVRFKFTEEFPAGPPKCWFATKIFHPNVSSAGEICVNTLKKDWKSSYGIGHILVTVKCLLIYPNPESALDEEAGKLLLEDYDSYFSRAKLITGVHATPRTKPPEFQPAGANDAEVSNALPTAAPSAPEPAQAIAIPSTSSTRKSVLPMPTSQPLQSSPENGLQPSHTSTTSCSSKDSKDRVTSPSPLSTADSNIGTLVTASKAVKRTAAPGTVGVEKRKKALKRL